MIAIMTPTGAPLYSNLTKNNIGLDSSCVLLKKTLMVFQGSRHIAEKITLEVMVTDYMVKVALT